MTTPIFSPNNCNWWYFFPILLQSTEKEFRNLANVRASTAQQFSFRKKFVGQKTKNNKFEMMIFSNYSPISFNFLQYSMRVTSHFNYTEIQNNKTIHHHGKPFCSKHMENRLIWIWYYSVLNIWIEPRLRE